mmetsp:Transcript_11512/g.27085  ORF Transcript_11512/g.27085 Transcript_11512/m.27085 type:complete len:250 (-) Transcript_11512:513-1262(-)
MASRAKARSPRNSGDAYSSAPAFCWMASRTTWRSPLNSGAAKARARPFERTARSTTWRSRCSSCGANLRASPFSATDPRAYARSSSLASNSRARHSRVFWIRATGASSRCPNSSPPKCPSSDHSSLNTSDSLCGESVFTIVNSFDLSRRLSRRMFLLFFGDGLFEGEVEASSRLTRRISLSFCLVAATSSEWRFRSSSRWRDLSSLILKAFAAASALARASLACLAAANRLSGCGLLGFGFGARGAGET